MKHNFIWIGCFFIFIIILFLFFPFKTEAEEIKEIKLGYCPTMKNLALEISKNNNYILIQMGSTTEVLENLKTNSIDIALIGRIAKNSEIDSLTKEKIIGEGYTLISNQKQFIQEMELNNLDIYTTIDEKIAEEILPNSNIIKSSINLENINLINWKYWKDEYELVVVYNGNNKVEKFRIPILYSKNIDLKKVKI